jgi:hypothetical protein
MDRVGLTQGGGFIHELLQLGILRHRKHFSGLFLVG